MKSLHLFVNKPYIPPELSTEKGPLLLHISDTPEESYNYVMKVIEHINPQYIVHTGDIVDNIKLETNANYLSTYENGLKNFIESIEIYDLIPYYVIGNHDSIKSVTKFSKKGIILEEGVIEIEGYSFYLSHQYEESKESYIKTNYWLFGHSPKPFHYKSEEQIILNGLLHMNIIALSTGNIYQIEYPLATNYYRKIEKGSIGI